LFLSHDAGIKREITSEELIRLIPKDNYPINDIRECLKVTDLVEFAKLKATDYDFKKIISLFNKLSNQRNIDNT
jgi:ABC-type transport system involved in cytochrome c biogenesis ATPase subunit